MTPPPGVASGRRAVQVILALTLLASVLAAAFVFTGYGRWLQRRTASTVSQRLGQVAGPTASWLPGVLAATPPDASILMVATRMADPDWLAAYYLYPRALHVVTPGELATRGADLPPAQFILQQGQLLTWPALQPALAEGTVVADLPAAATGLPPSFPSLRGLLALFLTVLTALGWGALILESLAPELISRTERHGRFGLALLAGLGFIGMTGFLAAFASLSAGWFLTSLISLAGLLALVPARRWFLVPCTEATDASPSHLSSLVPAGKVLRMAGVLLVAALATAGMMRALGEPMHHWDERFQWSYKAKILLHEGGINGPSFQEPDRPHLHRRYPLLLPALEAHTARLAGGFGEERAIKGMFPIFFAGLLLTLHAALRQRLPADAAWVPLLLCAALPPLHLATRIQGGPIHTGFADVPVAALATALALCLLPGRRTGGRLMVPAWGGAALFAGLLLAIKPEGVSFFGAALVVACLTLLRPSLRPDRRQTVMVVMIVGLTCAAVLALHTSVPTAGTVGYSGDENYLGRLTPAALSAGLSSNLPAAATALATAPFSSRWAYFGLLPVIALLAGLVRRRRLSGQHMLILLIVLPLCADLLALTVTGSEIRWHLNVALDRLWIQVAPLVILMAAGQLGRLWNPET